MPSCKGYFQKVKIKFFCFILQFVTEAVHIFYLPLLYFIALLVQSRLYILLFNFIN